MTAYDIFLALGIWIEVSIILALHIGPRISEHPPRSVQGPMLRALGRREP